MGRHGWHLHRACGVLRGLLDGDGPYSSTIHRWRVREAPVLLSTTFFRVLLVRAGVGWHDGSVRLVRWRRFDERTGTVCLGYPRRVGGDIGTNKLDYTEGPCDNEGQRGAALLGPAFGPARVARQCTCNVVNALVLRHLKAPPRASRSLRNNPALDATIACVARSMLGGAKRRWRDKWTVSKLRNIDLSRANDPDRPDRIKINIKREVCHDWIKRARGIQPYVNLRTQSEYGYMHMVWQKALCVVCGGDDGPIVGYEVFPGIHIAVASGWTAQRLSDWASVGGGWWYYERDGKSWDATMSRGLLRRKLRAMRVLDPRFALHVERGIVARGKYRREGRVVRWVSNEGTVKSGHNDTTSGNSFLNALICANALRDVGACGHILVVGDDLIARVDRRCEELSGVEACYGIEPSSRWFRDIEHCSFISGCWVRSGHGYLFSPLVGRLLKRLWWTVSPPSRRKLDQYRHGVACGILTTYGRHPLLSAFLGKYVLLRRRAPSITTHRPAGELDDSCGWADGLCERYGIDHEHLSVIGRMLAALPTCGAEYESYLLEPIFSRDMCDIEDRPVWRVR